MQEVLKELVRLNDPVILTPWTLGYGDDPCAQFQLTPEQAMTRDTLYRQMVAEIMLDHDPEFAKSLVDTGNKAFAMPGFFYFGNPLVDAAIEPDISKKLVMLPWVEACETEH